MRLADKVEHRETIFFRRVTQTATELLQKNCQTIGRAKKENGVNFRYIEALVEYITGEERTAAFLRGNHEVIRFVAAHPFRQGVLLKGFLLC